MICASYFTSPAGALWVAPTLMCITNKSTLKLEIRNGFYLWLQRAISYALQKKGLNEAISDRTHSQRYACGPPFYGLWLMVSGIMFAVSAFWCEEVGRANASWKPWLLCCRAFSSELRSISRIRISQGTFFLCKRWHADNDCHSVCTQIYTRVDEGKNAKPFSRYKWRYMHRLGEGAGVRHDPRSDARKGRGLEKRSKDNR